ncbi:hypothetical protein D9M68_710330 [compost metagenome]
MSTTRWYTAAFSVGSMPRRSLYPSLVLPINKASHSDARGPLWRGKAQMWACITSLGSLSRGRSNTRVSFTRSTVEPRRESVKAFSKVSTCSRSGAGRGEDGMWQIL